MSDKVANSFLFAANPFLFALFLSNIKEGDAIFLVDTFIPYLLYADDMIIAAEST